MSSAFLEVVIAFLMPYFIAPARDHADARSEIIDTLAAYATRTRAELLHAAHIIAFGLTTLETLAEAKTAVMPAAMCLRHRSCANGLARAMHQSEKALARSLDRDAPDARVEPAPAARATQAADATARHERLQNARTDPQTSRQAALSREERTKQHWAGAMMAALRQMPLQPTTFGNPPVP